MLFFVPDDALTYLLPAGSLGAAGTLLEIVMVAGRGGFSPHRMLLAGMVLSTAFTMLLLMLQASGDPRMAQILTWISGSTYRVTAHQSALAAGVMLVLFFVTPLVDDSATGRGNGPRRWHGADAIAYRSVAVGRLSDGQCHVADRAAEFYRIDGAAYCTDDRFSPHHAAYCDVGDDRCNDDDNG